LNREQRIWNEAVLLLDKDITLHAPEWLDDDEISEALQAWAKLNDY
jgi:hypothetical protein